MPWSLPLTVHSKVLCAKSTCERLRETCARWGGGGGSTELDEERFALGSEYGGADATTFLLLLQGDPTGLRNKNHLFT